MKISDPLLFETVKRLEGPRWADQDRRGGSTSLTRLLQIYEEFICYKTETGYEGKFDADMAAVYDHSGVVYGEGGMARYVMRSEELCLDGSSTYEEKLQKAEKLGIRVLR